MKSREGLTCVRMCWFFKYSTRSIEHSLVRVCFRQEDHCFFLQARVFISLCVFFHKVNCLFCKLSIDQFVRVFDKVHCVFCKLEYLSGHMCLRKAPLCPQVCVQCRVRGFMVSFVTNNNIYKFLERHILKALWRLFYKLLR